MEKIKPAKSISSISSLKFQKKSDYKKFLNFIKLETKELEKIGAPKEEKIKDILKVGGIGLLGFGLFNLLGRDKGDKGKMDVKGKSLGDFETPFAIGKPNEDDIDFKKQNIKFTPEVSKTSRIPKPVKTIVETPVNTTQSTLLKNQEFKEVQVKSKELAASASGKNKSRGSTKMGASASDSKFFKDLGLDSKFGKRGFGAKNLGAITVDEAEKLLADILGDPGKKINVPDRQLPILTKGEGKTFERKLTDAIFNLPDAAAEDEIFRALQDKGAARDVGVDRLMDEINNTKELRMKPSYNRVTIKAEMAFEYMKRRLSQLKSKGSKILGSISKTTQNLTPQFLKSDTVKPLFKSKTKTGLFALDLFFVGKEFYDLFVRPGDNIKTTLYDLYVSVNNAYFKDDPERLKYFITESKGSGRMFGLGVTNEQIRKKEIERNLKIKRLKEAAVVEEDSGNNIVIVPFENKKQSAASNSGMIPFIRDTSNNIVLPTYEPLNIGDNILLQKLNQ